MSIRASARVTGVAKNPITKLLLYLGAACSEYQDGALTNLYCERIETDEIWPCVGAKVRHLTAEQPTTTGHPDPDRHRLRHKLIPSGLAGDRDTHDCYVFLSPICAPGCSPDGVLD